MPLLCRNVKKKFKKKEKFKARWPCYDPSDDWIARGLPLGLCVGFSDGMLLPSAISAMDLNTIESNIHSSLGGNAIIIDSLLDVSHRL
jgi:hypothetical protein